MTRQNIRRTRNHNGSVNENAHAFPSDEREWPGRLCTISPELDGIILRCLKKRKDERYQTVDELLGDLGRLTG